MQNYNQNQSGNQGYSQNNNQYGNQYNNNQTSNWAAAPNQNQQNNNQYGNQGYPQNNNAVGGNWQPPPNQNQQYNNQYGNQYNNNQPSNLPAPNQNQQYDDASDGNWQPPPNQNNNNQTWQNKPETKVTQKGNTTITETIQSGGGKSSGRSETEFTGPSHFGPGRITSSGPYQPTNEQEKYDYFRLKLYESSCCCACASGNNHPCLNIWIWAIFWLIIFIFNGLINLIGSFTRLSRSDNVDTYSVISMIIIIASLCVNIAAMYGLFKLKPVTFLVQIVFFIIFLLLVIIGLFVYPFSLGFVVMNALFIVCDVWALYCFWRVYQWGKYFKSGGKYDPNMNIPS